MGMQLGSVRFMVALAVLADVYVVCQQRIAGLLGLGSF